MRFRHPLIRTTFASLIICPLLYTFNTFAETAPELSGNALTVFQQVMDGDFDGVSETLDGMSNAELAAMLREITANTEGQARIEVLRFLAKTALLIHDLDDLCELSRDLMRAVTEETEGKQAPISAVMRGIVEAMLIHPDLEDLTDEEKNSYLQDVASCAANAAVRAAELDDEIDVVQVAEAVAKGGARGLGEDIDPDQLRALVDGMSDGGVGGAEVPNKPAVARAIMRAVARVIPPEVRDIPDFFRVLPEPPDNPVEPEDVSAF